MAEGEGAGPAAGAGPCATGRAAAGAAAGDARICRAKRCLDVALALGLGIALLPVFGLCALAVLACDGGPVLYPAVRAGEGGRPFTQWKFRTMVPGSDADGGVSGGSKRDLITPVGRWLRRYRLDELPQIWNVLSGEMSFVGPRPPLQRYVERFPDLYAEVLRARPGITGLATLRFHRREEALLSRCMTPEETDAVYSARCVPAKARLDRLYLRRRSLGLDLWILWRTVAVVLFRRRCLPAAPRRRGPRVAPAGRSAPAGRWSAPAGT
jgi:lipopolysaccharide/colanic/teichoic acid biosynthesis glycosyltransferase